MWTAGPRVRGANGGGRGEIPRGAERSTPVGHTRINTFCCVLRSLRAKERRPLTAPALSSPQDNSEGMRMVYGLDGREICVLCSAEARNFSHFLSFQTDSAHNQPPIRLAPEALFPGVKRPERESQNSPPSNVKVTNAWSYTSAPPIRLHDVIIN
jgi:hypothetical protein